MVAREHTASTRPDVEAASLPLDAAQQAERIADLEEALRTVRNLVAATAGAVGDAESLPGAVVLGLDTQVDALTRRVLR